MYTVFEVEYYDGMFKRWIKEARFYLGDLSDVNVSADPRFYAVQEKRMEAKMLGTCDVSLPLETKDYPITLNNGNILHQYEKIKTKEEE